MHVRGNQATTASMVAAVGSPAGGSRAARGDAPVIRLWVALGSPCVSVYVPLAFDAPMPPLLGAASTWHRFARLRDRVDADPEALAAVRAVLAPIELALGTGPASDLSALDAALTSLGV